MRTFMVVHEQILGAPATAYTERLHLWFTRGLSKRSASGTLQATSALADKDALSLQKTVKEMQTAVGPDFTVTWSTVFVLRCETRQVCQKYGFGGIEKMTQAVQRSSTLQAVVEEQRQALLREEMPGKCHTVQIFEAIAKHKGWSQQYLRRHHNRKSAASVCRAVGAGRLCPKVVLEKRTAADWRGVGNQAEAPEDERLRSWIVFASTRRDTSSQQQGAECVSTESQRCE